MEDYLFNAFNTHLIDFLERLKQTYKSSVGGFPDDGDTLKSLFEEELEEKIDQFLNNESWNEILEAHKPEEE